MILWEALVFEYLLHGASLGSSNNAIGGLKMRNKLVLCGFLCIASDLASAGWISADDFAVGTDVSNVVSGVTFGVVTHEFFAPDVQYHPSIIGLYGEGSSHQGFAQVYGNAYDLLHTPSFEESFSLFTVTFSSPTRSFGFAAGNYSSDPIVLTLYDPLGNYISTSFFTLDYKPDNCTPLGCDSPYLTKKQKLHFDTEVGFITLGSENAGSQITDVFIDRRHSSVPEPGSLGLLAAGIVGLAVARRSKK